MSNDSLKINSGKNYVILLINNIISKQLTKETNENGQANTLPKKAEREREKKSRCAQLITMIPFNFIINSNNFTSFSSYNLNNNIHSQLVAKLLCQNLSNIHDTIHDENCDDWKLETKIDFPHFPMLPYASTHGAIHFDSCDA